MTESTCAHPSTACPDEWVACAVAEDWRQVVWRQCETTATAWRSGGGVLWQAVGVGRDARHRMIETCESGGGWL